MGNIILPASVVKREQEAQQKAAEEKLAKMPLLGFDPGSSEYEQVDKLLGDVLQLVYDRSYGGNPADMRLQQARMAAVYHLAQTLLAEDWDAELLT